MTKVSIIEVDLGADIDTIIEEDVKELTGAAKQELDTAIDLAKQRDALRDKKSSAKQHVVDAIVGVMAEAYEKLEQAGADGILCSDIMGIVGEHVPNSSAFSLRMKKVLREKGNPYLLGRKKVQGNPRYMFSPFNEETTP